MIERVLVVLGLWLAANLLLLIVGLVYAAVERRVGRDPLDPIFNEDRQQRQHRAVVVELYPPQERRIQGAPQRRPGVARTTPAMTHQRRDLDEHHPS